MKEDKPPRKKVSSKRKNPEDVSGRPPGRSEAPAAAERTDESTTNSQGPATDAPDKRDSRRQPVTNQDEQDKITNASDADQPIAE